MTDTPVLVRPTYRVALATDDGGERELTVQVRAIDRMNAERDAPKYGLPDSRSMPQTTTALWIYYALLRTGEVAVKWSAFRDTVMEFDPIKAEAVDPTQAASSASPSSAPTTSEAAPTTG